MTKLNALRIFLIILMAIIPVIVGFFSILFIQLFSSPMDYFNSIFSKLVVWVGMSLAFMILLVLPFDKWALDGALSVATPYIWQVLFACIAVYIVVIIPFAFWYYEGHDTDRSFAKGIMIQSCWGLTGAGVSICLFLVGILLSYFWLGYAELTVEIQNQAAYTESIFSAYQNFTTDMNTVSGSSILDIRMSFIVYLTAILSIAGWVVFALFGGCGMSALPVDLICCCIKRPKKITQHEFLRAQKQFANRAEKLIKLGQLINEQRKTFKGRTGRKNISKYSKFKKAVYKCESDYKKLETAYKNGGGSPFLYIFAVLFGIICALLTILWILQIAIYMIPKPPAWGFLNQFFIWFDMGFPLFGLIGYLIFTYYLMIAVIAGNVRIMSRIPLVAVFPIKYKDTSTSSFLYNTGLLLLVSITIVQFSAQAFASYINYTAISGFFNVIVANMIYLKYFYEYIFYVFFAFIFIGMGLTVISLIPGPCNNWHKSPEEEELDDILHSLEREAKSG
jgi:LMBR1 domain-containing protein 1